MLLFVGKLCERDYHIYVCAIKYSAIFLCKPYLLLFILSVDSIIVDLCKVADNRIEVGIFV